MNKSLFVPSLFCFSIALFVACSKNNGQQESYPNIQATFGANINLNELANYSAQPRPAYITKDNSGANPITNSKATLGRVLFYDKSLSIDNTVSCGSCHQQQFAFGDPVVPSKGVEGGTTGRHSMRLINTRFSEELKFFWNERASSLELQTTQPIQDHAEMGFSGQNGRPTLNTLLNKLENLGYYQELFQFVYGDKLITETRLQECLSQFIRSIQSFDSKFDAERTLVQNDGAPFPNFTQLENQGKQLFLTRPQFGQGGIRTGGGAGCAGCHRPPEFDIDPNSRNNGITATIARNVQDFNNTRSPSLRDLTNKTGAVNTPMMHNGGISNLRNVILHYNSIIASTENNNLDPRLAAGTGPGGVGQQLQLTDQEINAMVAFLQTLSGSNVYTDKKWSNPFLK
jgi:cytochrome c peroxidase